MPVALVGMTENVQSSMYPPQLVNEVVAAQCRQIQLGLERPMSDENVSVAWSRVHPYICLPRILKRLVTLAPNLGLP